MYFRSFLRHRLYVHLIATNRVVFVGLFEIRAGVLWRLCHPGISSPESLRDSKHLFGLTLGIARGAPARGTGWVSPI